MNNLSIFQIDNRDLLKFKITFGEVFTERMKRYGYDKDLTDSLYKAHIELWNTTAAALYTEGLELIFRKEVDVHQKEVTTFGRTFVHWLWDFVLLRRRIPRVSAYPFLMCGVVVESYSEYFEKAYNKLTELYNTAIYFTCNNYRRITQEDLDEIIRMGQRARAILLCCNSETDTDGFYVYDYLNFRGKSYVFNSLNPSCNAISCEGADLREVTISDCVLEGVFRNADFSKAVFRNVEFKGDFREALFAGATFRGCTITNKALFDYANFYDVLCADTDFSEAAAPEGIVTKFATGLRFPDTENREE